ncbi:MAG TPA: phosphoribosyltransferase family protein [Mycobacteriales bacterium]|nr:phosphoribosyltransferase family protein [Mycobacteriales bacterium]
MRFADRTDAGRALGAAVRERLAAADAVVLGLPRGGVPVAAEVAAALQAPLDVFVVRKLGTPGHRELAMGAIASGGVRVMNDAVVRRLGVPPDAVERVAAEEQAELERREREYRGDRQPADVGGRTAVLVDDGLATGATVLAAVEAVRALGPERVVVAAPVGAPEACRRVAERADDVVCLLAPDGFGAVGAFYVDFAQTSDDEVRRLLAR